MKPLPPAWMHSPTTKPSICGAGSESFEHGKAWLMRRAAHQIPSSTRYASDAGRPHLRILSGGQRGIVGHAEERHLPPLDVEERVRGGGIAIARLAHGPDDGQPPPVAADGNRRSRAPAGIREHAPRPPRSTATDRAGGRKTCSSRRWRRCSAGLRPDCRCNPSAPGRPPMRERSRCRLRARSSGSAARKRLCSAVSVSRAQSIAARAASLK